MMAENSVLEDLIKSIFNDIKDGNILVKSLPKDNEEYIHNISAKLAMLIHEHFIDRGFGDVYPYSIEGVTWNSMMDVKEYALRVVLKGRSIEYAFIPDIVKSSFLVKMLHTSEFIFNQYRIHDNVILTIKVGYKKKGLKVEHRINRSTPIPADTISSGFFLQLPVSEPDLC